jgi:hypothetical protein
MRPKLPTELYDEQIRSPPRPYADVAARKIVELANAVEPVQAGRIHIESSTGRCYSS